MAHVTATDVPPLRVQVGSFNCNLQGASSASPDLTHWLVPTVSEASTEYTTTQEQGRTAPDFYAVGFQELFALHDGFADNARAHEAISRTDRAIRRAIRPQAALTRPDGKYPQDGGPEDYTLVATARIVGIVLFVYARERRPSGRLGLPSAVERIKEIRTSTAGTGILNLLGNKGAAGVRLVVSASVPGDPDETLTFVCAHLAAHDHNVARRNADWHSIVARLAFPPSSVVSLPPAPIGLEKRATDNVADEKKLDEAATKYESVQKNKDTKTKAVALDQQTYGLYETSHLFFFGDLNYRIAFNAKPSPSLSRKGSQAPVLKKSDIQRKINQEDWKTLATYDQLSIEHTASDGPRVFQGLTEPPLNLVGYPPTYKYKVDKAARKAAEEAAESYEGLQVTQAEKTAGKASTSELSGKRVPGWTDRILWASSANLNDSTGLQGVVPELWRSIMRYTVCIGSAASLPLITPSL